MLRAVPAAESDVQRLARNALKERNAAAAAATEWPRMPQINTNELNLEMIYITGFHKTVSTRVMNDSYKRTTRGSVTEHTRATSVQLAPLLGLDDVSRVRGVNQACAKCAMSLTHCKYSQLIISSP